jgi:hypothetical protein
LLEKKNQQKSQKRVVMKLGPSDVGLLEMARDAIKQPKNFPSEIFSKGNRHFPSVHSEFFAITGDRPAKLLV